MLLYLGLAVALALILTPLFRRLRAGARTPAGRRQLNKALIGLLIALLVLLTVTGRLNWLFAAVAVALPALFRLAQLLRYLPAAQKVFRHFQGAGSGTGSGARDSSIGTATLHLILDHDSGEMNGEVLRGRFQGRRLQSLSLDELLELLAEIDRDDPESRPLLEAYLDRMRGEQWRQSAGSEGARGASGAGADGASGGPMSQDEARAVLGLEAGATREDVLGAHRRLMQKLHPDRGGSAYLAAKLNQARDCLLAD